MKRRRMSEHDKEVLYNLLKRVVVLLGGLWVAWWSANFSVDGFGFSVPRFREAGWAFAVAIFGIELVANKEGFKNHLTLTVLAIGAYTYGILTNVVGVWTAQGSPDIARSNGLALVAPAAIGTLSEIMPEVMIAYAILGTTNGVPDILAHIFGFKKAPSLDAVFKQTSYLMSIFANDQAKQQMARPLSLLVEKAGLGSVAKFELPHFIKLAETLLANANDRVLEVLLIKEQPQQVQGATPAHAPAH